MSSTKWCDGCFFSPSHNLISGSSFLLQLRALIETLHGHSDICPDSLPPPSGILRDEIDKACEMLAAAKSNPSECPAASRCSSNDFFSKVQVPWSALEYQHAFPSRPHGRDGVVEEKLERLFPPLQCYKGLVLSAPCVITDQDGRILTWYLPQVLTVHRLVCYFIQSCV